MTTPRISDAQWNIHKDEIYDLYVNQARTLQETMSIMTRNHKFSPTKAQYIRKLDSWSMKKNVTRDQWKRTADIIESRQNLGKESEIMIDGRIIPGKRLKKALRRPEVKKICVESSRSATTNNFSRDIEALSPKFDIAPIGGPQALIADPSPPWNLTRPFGDFACTEGCEILQDAMHFSPEPDAPLVGGTLGPVLTNIYWLPGISNIPMTLPLFRTQRLLRSFPLELLKSERSQVSKLMGLLTSNDGGPATGLGKDLAAVSNKSTSKIKPPSLPERLNFFVGKHQDNKQTGQLASFQPFLSLLHWAVYMCANNLIEDNQLDTIIELVDSPGLIQGLTSKIDMGDPSRKIFISKILRQAIITEKFRLARALLKAGISLDCQPRKRIDWDTALLEAAAHRRMESIAFLLQHGGDSFFSDISFSDLLCITCDSDDASQNCWKLLKLLIKHEAKLSYRFFVYYGAREWRRRPFHFRTLLDELGSDQSIYRLNSELQFAVKNKHQMQVKRLLEQGASPNLLFNYNTDYGNTRLARLVTIAAIIDSNDVVQTLLENGADPNGKISQADVAEYYNLASDVILEVPTAETPLHYAAVAKNLDMIKLLLRHGADYSSLYSASHVEALLSEHNDELFERIEEGDHNVVKKLLCQGADPNASRISDGRRLLDITLERLKQIEITYGKPILWTKYAIMLERLMKYGADVNAKDANGVPFFVRLVDTSYADVIEIALQHGAHIGSIKGVKCDAISNSEAFCDTLLVLLDHGLDVNAHCPGRETFLEHAIACKDLALASFLLDNGGDPTKVSTGRPSLVRQAVESTNTVFAIKMLDVLLAHHMAFDDYELVDSTFNTRNLLSFLSLENVSAESLLEHLSMTPLQVAAMTGKIQVFKLLHKRGANINALPGRPAGLTALQAAILCDQWKMVDALLSLNANINMPAATGCGVTALQAAILGENIELAGRLLDANVDVNSPGVDGITALRISIKQGDLEFTQRLLTAGADVNALAALSDGRTALQAAVAKGNYELVKILLSYNADVNAPAAPVDGRTAIQAAVAKGNYELVKILLSYNADVNAPAAPVGGRTALQATAARGNHELVKILLRHNADVNALACVERGATALQFAAISGDFDTFALLLEHGADLNAAPSEIDGRTVIQGAAEHGRLDIVHFLLENACMLSLSDCEEAAKLAQNVGHTVVAGEIRNWVRDHPDRVSDLNIC